VLLICRDEFQLQNDEANPAGMAPRNADFLQNPTAIPDRVRRMVGQH